MYHGINDWDVLHQLEHFCSHTEPWVELSPGDKVAFGRLHGIDLTARWLSYNPDLRVMGMGCIFNAQRNTYSGDLSGLQFMQKLRKLTREGHDVGVDRACVINVQKLQTGVWTFMNCEDIDVLLDRFIDVAPVYGSKGPFHVWTEDFQPVPWARYRQGLPQAIRHILSGGHL